MSEVSRRSFAESLAVAALAPLIGTPPGSIRLAGWPAMGEAVNHDPSAMARALTEVVRAQYGARLSSADLATIARQIQTGLERVDQLRKVQLANGDEPDCIFTVVRRTPPV
jgi:hypothetical protein